MFFYFMISSPPDQAHVNKSIKFTHLSFVNISLNLMNVNIFLYILHYVVKGGVKIDLFEEFIRPCYLRLYTKFQFSTVPGIGQKGCVRWWVDGRMGDVLKLIFYEEV